MRAQPPHTGHAHIIDKIIEDGLQPVIILGSANESGTFNNPYTVGQRIKMLHMMYPSIIIGAVNDYDDEEQWVAELCDTVSMVTDGSLSTSTIYLHEKLEDLKDFTFRGVDYSNESYCKTYEVLGLHTTSLPISDIQIRAKSIREDLEGNKQYLHQKVYEYIKTLKETHVH